MIKLIVFDLWRTLAHEDLEGKHSTSIMLESMKLGFSREKFIELFENSTQTKKWDKKTDAYANLCKHIGLTQDKKNIMLIKKIRDLAEKKIKPYSHTISMLKQIKKKGYKIGLLSNSTVFAVAQVKKNTKILEYIDYPLFSFNVGTVKPDLKFFRKILEISGCTPKEAIMIGDKKDADITPAKKIGMHTILYRDYETLKKDFTKFGIFLN